MATTIYPGSMPYDDVIVRDQSSYSDNPTVVETPFIPKGPCAFIPFISPRGYGEDNKLEYMSDAKLSKFGKPNLKKYGLTLYLAKRFIAAGGTLLGMRVTAPGMKYAHAVIVANVISDNIAIDHITNFNNMNNSTTMNPYFVDSHGNKVIIPDIQVTDVTRFDNIMIRENNVLVPVISKEAITVTINGELRDLTVVTNSESETHEFTLEYKAKSTDEDPTEIYTPSWFNCNPLITYTVEPINNIDTTEAPSIDGLVTAVKNKFDNKADVYPIALIVSKGAGEYANSFKFRITPDELTNTYNKENGLSGFCYKFICNDNGAKLSDPFSFSFDDDYVYNGKSMSIDETFEKYSSDIKMIKLAGYDKLLEDYTDIDETTDILFGTNAEDNTLFIDCVNGADLSVSTGFKLNGGADVAHKFDWKNDPFASQLVKAYTGEIDDMIYDQVKYPYQHLFAPSLDANLLAAIKQLADDRKATRAHFFTCGQTTEVPKSYEDAREAAKSIPSDSFKYETVVEWARCVDPYTDRRTYFPSVYWNAYAIPYHWINRKGKPLAGDYGATWEGFEIGSVMPRSAKPDQWISNHNAQINTMMEDGLGKAVLYEQITSQKTTSALSEINNAMTLIEMVRIALRVARDTRWIDLGDIEATEYASKVKGAIEAELNGCYDSVEIVSQQESVNGAGANRIYCRINVKFKNILKGITYDFYIVAN